MLETARLNHALRTGYRPNVASAPRTPHGLGHFDSLPSGPLLAAMTKYVGVVRRDGKHDETWATFFERVGISDRTERRWRFDGDRAAFDSCDSILQAMNLLWFDVWSLPEERAGEHGRPEDVGAYIQQVFDYQTAQAYFEG